MCRAPAARARSRPARLGTSTGIANAFRCRQHREEDLGVVELRHPLGGHEAGGLDRPQPGRDQSGNELRLGGGGHDGRLVLQAIAGADLVDVDRTRAGRGRRWMLGVRTVTVVGPAPVMSSRGWSRRTDSPGLHQKLSHGPSCGAVDDVLHLHGLHHHEGLSGVYRFAGADVHSQHRTRHGAGEAARGRTGRAAPIDAGLALGQLPGLALVSEPEGRPVAGVTEAGGGAVGVDDQVGAGQAGPGCHRGGAAKADHTGGDGDGGLDHLAGYLPLAGDLGRPGHPPAVQKIPRVDDRSPAARPADLTAGRPQPPPRPGPPGRRGSGPIRSTSSVSSRPETTSGWARRRRRNPTLVVTPST